MTKSIFLFLEGCNIKDFAFAGHNILIEDGGQYNMHDSWEKCMEACQIITECKYWTYYTDAVTDKPEWCELFHYDDPDVDADVVVVGAISGPKTCPEPGST